mmetsp:Transcript_19528/g.49646  ORF Transcript_19528/g.49646 Transcript_19528/m.49646 type:complete len:251 (+) Transcript_19528:1591-2343(+)
MLRVKWEECVALSLRIRAGLHQPLPVHDGLREDYVGGPLLVDFAVALPRRVLSLRHALHRCASELRRALKVSRVVEALPNRVPAILHLVALVVRGVVLARRLVVRRGHDAGVVPALPVLAVVAAGGLKRVVCAVLVRAKVAVDELQTAVVLVLIALIWREERGLVALRGALLLLVLNLDVCERVPRRDALLVHEAHHRRKRVRHTLPLQFGIQGKTVAASVRVVDLCELVPAAFIESAAAVALGRKRLVH